MFRQNNSQRDQLQRTWNFDQCYMVLILVIQTLSWEFVSFLTCFIFVSSRKRSRFFFFSKHRGWCSLADGWARGQKAEDEGRWARRKNRKYFRFVKKLKISWLNWLNWVYVFQWDLFFWFTLDIRHFVPLTLLSSAHLRTRMVMKVLTFLDKIWFSGWVSLMDFSSDFCNCWKGGRSHGTSANHSKSWYWIRDFRYVLKSL